MMKNNHNMFHFDLQDIQKFNFRQSEFIDSHYEQLREDFADLIKIFISKLGLGECKHGLHRGEWRLQCEPVILIVLIDNVTWN